MVHLFAKEKAFLFEITVVVLMLVALVGGYIAVQHHATSQALKRAQLMMMEVASVQKYVHEVIYPQCIALLKSDTPSPTSLDPSTVSTRLILDSMVATYNDILSQHQLPAVQLEFIYKRSDDPQLRATSQEQILIEQFSQSPPLFLFMKFAPSTTLESSITRHLLNIIQFLNH